MLRHQNGETCIARCFLKNRGEKGIHIHLSMSVLLGKTRPEAEQCRVGEEQT